MQLCTSPESSSLARQDLHSGLPTPRREIVQGNWDTLPEDNQRQVLTFITANNQQDEAETDQMTKAMKVMITDDRLQKVKSTFVSGLLFMVEQLQMEVQQEFRTI